MITRESIPKDMPSIQYKMGESEDYAEQSELILSAGLEEAPYIR